MTFSTYATPPPITPRQVKRLHILFAELGDIATTAWRDQIQFKAGSPSTKSLSEYQAWALIQEITEGLKAKNPEPIAVEWCPKYAWGKAKLGEANVVTLPGQSQVWFLFHALRQAGIQHPASYLARRFKLKDGVIRTADEASTVAKAVQTMAGARRARNIAPLRAWDTVAGSLHPPLSERKADEVPCKT